jgi:hypothetical protein
MSYVIYNTDTTYIFYAKGKRWYNASYKTEAAAKAALTRETKAGRLSKKELKTLAIADKREFHDKIEKKVVKKNLMSGKDMEPMGVNEPLCTDPSSETYWSM